MHINVRVCDLFIWVFVILKVGATHGKSESVTPLEYDRNCPFIISVLVSLTANGSVLPLMYIIMVPVDAF